MTARRSKAKPAADAREPAQQITIAPPSTKPQSWHEQAAFHLTLDQAPEVGNTGAWRTHVYHEESGEEQTQPGVLRPDVLQWICDRAAAPREAPDPIVEPQPAPQAAPSAQAGRLSVEELAVEVSGGEQPDSASAATRLRAHVRFTIAELSDHIISTATSRYWIQVLAYERDSGLATVLASGWRALDKRATNVSDDIALDLPPLGDYQLLANVILDDDELVAAGLGPRLAVVP